MRIVVDLPPRVARLSAEAVERGAYGSIDDLIVDALLALFRADSAPPPPNGRSDTEPPAVPESGARVIGASVQNRDPLAGWLWGMVNRVYPLKVAVRVCAKLAEGGPVLLQTLHAAFANRGQEIGNLLRNSDQAQGRRRNEGLAVGFPLSSDDEQKARVRFAHQFIGRRSGSGTYVGGAFETGIIGVTEPGTDWVAPTLLGWRFAELHNELLDAGTVTGRNLNEQERHFYLSELAPSVPAERNAFRPILEILAAGSLDSATLAARLQPFQDQSLPEALRDTSRSGALARLADVGGIARTAVGRSANYKITSLGKDAIAWLRDERVNQ